MTDAPERLCFVNCGLPGDQCACFRDMMRRAERAEAARDRFKYVLEGVRSAIKTGRNEPLQIWLDQINIALDAEKLPDRAAIPDQPEVKALVEELTLAANRLHRCAINYDIGTRNFIVVCEWSDEALAALAAFEAKP